MNEMAEISVQKLNWREWSNFAPTWDRIHSLCSDASFFLSREWVDCWLLTFGEDLNPDLLTFVKDGNVVGCCLLVWRTQWVRGVRIRRVYLNCAGENERDSTCIEYNSLLSLPDCEESVAKALRTFLYSRSWDEFILKGVLEHSSLTAVASSLGRAEISLSPSHYVDLCRIRSDAGTFDSVLSSNTRQQIRRSQRLYEQATGPCTFRVARTAEEAAEMLTALANLHQAAWQSRGWPGAFASQQFADFHQRLIQAAFEDKRVMLFEVRAGSEVIGSLYYFLYRGRVYFYQSGFHKTTDGRMKPGLLTHYLAIRYCIGQPELNEYDFLAGDSQYKRSLATASRPLRWIVIRRSTVASFLFLSLRLVKRKYVQLVKKSRRKAYCNVSGFEGAAELSVPNIETRRVVSAHTNEKSISWRKLFSVTLTRNGRPQFGAGCY